MAADPPISSPGVPSADEARRVKLKLAVGAPDPSTLPGAVAAFNPRVMAALIDYALAVALAIGVAGFLPDFLGVLLGAAYFVTRDSLPFLAGQGIGKRMMGLRAQTVGGDSLVGNWRVALIRNGPLLITPFVLVEIYVLLSREEKARKGTRLGDEWAHTKVVIASSEPPHPAADPPV